ncbi:MAG TPA: VOC family protein [Saprospiraceae bacterium]|nr:VOC family protein [Saprospiraceae bacterium]
MTDILGCNVTIMVQSMDDAVKFYCDVLGFNLKNRYGDHWADVEAPGMAIGLHPANKDVKTGNNLSLGLRVNDLKKSVSVFQQKGLQFVVKDDGQVLLASFTDPDGNSLYLVESKW